MRRVPGSSRRSGRAKRAAESVCGSAKMENELEVRVLNESKDEAELLGAVLRAPMLDDLVPSTVDPTVEDGGVTLTGSASWQFERDEAGFQVGKALAVLDLLEEIDLNSPTAEAGDLKIVFKGAFGHNSKLNADDLSVPTSSGTVTLEGIVSRWSEHVEAAAWAAPAVTKVDCRFLF